MPDALFMNGMYESALIDIQNAQREHPGATCYLQPYSRGRVLFLASYPPTPGNPVTVFFSLTDSLGDISYRAKIVGWQDKRKLDKPTLDALNRSMAKYQPTEIEQVYPEARPGKICVNLISITDVVRLPPGIPVTCLIKVSDGLPHKVKTQPGNWSVVQEPPPWLLTLTEGTQVEAEFATSVLRSGSDSAEARHARLAIAAQIPESIFVWARSFRRNPDVVAEVLSRAKGHCEECHNPAPFMRRDNTPYLEVHHRKTLANGGTDTVENAVALCPNCHRRLHFGKEDTD